MGNGSISEAQTGVTPASSPPKGNPPEPSNRLPRVSVVCSIQFHQPFPQGRIKRLGSEAVPSVQPFFLEIKALFQLYHRVSIFEGAPSHGIPPLELLPQVGKVSVKHTAVSANDKMKENAEEKM